MIKIRLKLRNIATKPEDLVGRVYKFSGDSDIIWKYTYADEKVVKYVYLKSNNMEHVEGDMGEEIIDNSSVNDLKAILEGNIIEIVKN